jgi:hypothetical protein
VDAKNPGALLSIKPVESADLDAAVAIFDRPSKRHPPGR